MSIIIPANSAVGGGFDVDNSVRLDGTSAYLTRTPSSAGNRQKWTWSGWVKRSSNFAAQQTFFGVSATTNTYHLIYFSGNDTITHNYQGIVLETNAKYRDPSAWYHIVLAVDTTQATDTNRIKLYINGVQETSFSSSGYPSQNTEMNINNTVQHDVANSGASYNHYINGYMAEVCFINNQQLDQTSFGEFDEDSGIWKPIDVSGLTFGTNGFYLDFEDSSALGNDAAGSNNYTTVNLAAIDQSTDTCTNNFATLNPLCTGSLITLSEGNLKALGNSGSDSSTTTATIGITEGKFYWEVKVGSTGSGYPYFGIYEDFDSLVQGNLQGQANGTRVMTVYAVGGGTTLFKPGTNLTITAPATNNIIMFAVDKDNDKFYMGVNGTWYNSGNPTSGATGTGSLADLDANGTVMFGSHNYNNSFIEINFGNPTFTGTDQSDGNSRGSFEYTPPSGYLSLCTANLSEVLG